MPVPCSRCTHGTYVRRTGNMWWQVQHLRCAFCKGTGQVHRAPIGAYTLHANAEAEAFLTVLPGNLGRVVEDLIGRNALSYPSVRDKLRREGRVYLAGRKRGQGVIARKVSA